MDKNSIVYKELNNIAEIMPFGGNVGRFVNKSDLISAFQKIKEDATTVADNLRSEFADIGDDEDDLFEDKKYHYIIAMGEISAYQKIIDALNQQ